MLVEFDPKWIPSMLEWAAWDGLDGPVIDVRPVELDSELTVYAYHAYVDGAVVGFRWS
jgi:hypothetical protein